jgi:lipopolysaccharide/colanic/teichoic acid biosynthesis glycosyltransferase
MRKFELDKYYMKHRSLGFDLKIMYRTVRYVIMGSGNKLA